MTTTSSAGPWGAIPQSEGVAQAVETAIEKVQDHLPQSVENRMPFKDTSYHSSDTDTSSELEKIGSTQGVAQLARQLTQQSGQADGGDQKLARLHTARSIKDIGGDYRNSFIDPSDPALDPNSGQFRPEAWVRTLIGLQSRDPERYPQRVAGVAYKNLNVHGFGSLTDYQKYVRTGTLPRLLANLSHLELSATIPSKPRPYSRSSLVETNTRFRSFVTSKGWSAAEKC